MLPESILIHQNAARIHPRARPASRFHNSQSTMLLAIAAPADDRRSIPEPWDSLSSFPNEPPTMLPELIPVHQNAATIYSKAWQAYRLHKHQSNMLLAISALAGERQSSQPLMLYPECCQNWFWYTRMLPESTPEPDKPNNSTKADSTRINSHCL